MNGKVQKKMLWKIKFWSKKKFFFGTVNQLKKTSDCIKIDPPGPGRNFEKKSKKSKKNDFFLYFFCVFIVKTRVF